MDNYNEDIIEITMFAMFGILLLLILLLVSIFSLNLQSVIIAIAGVSLGTAGYRYYTLRRHYIFIKRNKEK